MDRGIHVHARIKPGDKKEMDQTYRGVRLVGRNLPSGGVLVSELDAIYYMVSSVFGFENRDVRCTYCGWPHLDRDFFSVHPHRTHLCAGCGRHFADVGRGIGNPIVAVRQACGLTSHRTKRARKKLNIRQADYPGGVQIWGSNTAFVWTSSKAEEEGIHVHGYSSDKVEPDFDDTFGEVIIDGIRLDPEAVRVFMAQTAMPSLDGRVKSVSCVACGEQQFSRGEAAFTPSSEHACGNCHRPLAAAGRLRKTILNPLPAILEHLEQGAMRPPQRHRLNLLTEAP
jgi:hypothetical protein